MKDYITKAIKTFYGAIDDKNTRYRSWEWCYSAFNDKRKEYYETNEENKKEEIVDYLALHLGFYLASWGMYRGSSFLLQRDYKAHIKAVKILLEGQYKYLWGYNPSNKNICGLIFEREDCLYNRIKNSYKVQTNGEDKASNEDYIASDTLVTKILMGTMGCVPAFDRFLKKGISWFKGKNEKDKYKNLTQTIDNSGKTYDALREICADYKDYLKVEGATLYTEMKCLDMFLWQVGFELDLCDNLKNDNKKNEHQKLINIANKLGLSEKNDKGEIIDNIKKRWGIQ